MSRDTTEAINSYLTDMLALEQHIEVAIDAQVKEDSMSRQFKRQVVRALESALIAYLPIILMALIRRGLARRGSRTATTAEA